MILVSESEWTEERYYSILKSPAYGLWNGTYTKGEFLEAFEAAIVKGLRIAWEQGAAEMGIIPEDMTDAERGALQIALFDQFQYTENFADYIGDLSKANGGSWGAVNVRLRMWSNKFSLFQGMGRAYAKLDKKLEWVLGPTEKHCSDCSKLNGKVKRASQWLIARGEGIYPQSRQLECKGYNCGCELQPTDKPMSKGILPRVSK